MIENRDDIIRCAVSYLLENIQDAETQLDVFFNYEALAKLEKELYEKQNNKE